MPMATDGTHEETGDAIASMTMPASAQTSSDRDESVPPCQQPWVPGGTGSCATMTSCAPPAVSAAPETVLVREHPHAPEIRLALATPPSRAEAPEPPPPKA